MNTLFSVLGCSKTTYFVNGYFWYGREMHIGVLEVCYSFIFSKSVHVGRGRGTLHKTLRYTECLVYYTSCEYLFKANMNSYIQLQTAAIFFSIEPLSTTGYWLGVCHGWFHLQGLTGGVKNANWVRITKLKSLAHRGIRTRDLPLTKRARHHWATKADVNRADKSSPGFYLCYF